LSLSFSPNETVKKISEQSSSGDKVHVFMSSFIEKAGVENTVSVSRMFEFV